MQYVQDFFSSGNKAKLARHSDKESFAAAAAKKFGMPTTILFYPPLIVVRPARPPGQPDRLRLLTHSALEGPAAAAVASHDMMIS